MRFTTALACFAAVALVSVSAYHPQHHPSPAKLSLTICASFVSIGC